MLYARSKVGAVALSAEQLLARDCISSLTIFWVITPSSAASVLNRTATEVPIPSGRNLGRYEVRSQIGAGGMGEVYLAQDTSELGHGRFFCAEAGDKDRAFAALNEAVDKADQFIGFVKIDPFMKPLRNDPRFQTGGEANRLSELI